MDIINCECFNKVMKDFDEGARKLLKKAKLVNGILKAETVYKEEEKVVEKVEEEPTIKGYVYNKYTKKADSLDFEVPSLETYNSTTTRSMSPMTPRAPAPGAPNAPNAPKASPQPIVRDSDASVTTFTITHDPFETTVSARPTPHPIVRSSSASLTTYSTSSDPFNTTIRSPATSSDLSTFPNSPLLPSLADFSPVTTFDSKYARRVGSHKEYLPLRGLVKQRLSDESFEIYLVFFDEARAKCLDLWFDMHQKVVRAAKVDGKALKKVERK